MMSPRDDVRIVRRLAIPPWSYFDAGTGTKFTASNLPEVFPPVGRWEDSLVPAAGDHVLVDRPDFRCYVDKDRSMHVLTPGEEPGHHAVFPVSALPEGALVDLARFLLLGTIKEESDP